MLSTLLRGALGQELATPESPSSRFQELVPASLRPAYVVDYNMGTLLLLNERGNFQVVAWHGELELTARGFMSSFRLLERRNAALSAALRDCTPNFDEIRALAAKEVAAGGQLCRRIDRDLE